MFIQIPIQTILLRFLRSSSNFPEIITEFILYTYCIAAKDPDLNCLADLCYPNIDSALKVTDLNSARAQLAERPLSVKFVVCKVCIVTLRSSNQTIFV